MSIEQYFAKLPKDTPLSLAWKPSPPAPKRQKRGPGRPRKKQPQPPPTIVTIDDSDKENDPDDTQDGSRVSSSVSETTDREVEGERTTSVKRLYSTKQKRIIVAYAKEHSVAAATKKFSIPRSTIGRWMVDGYFARDVTKRGVKKGAGRPLTYSQEIDEQLLV